MKINEDKKKKKTFETAYVECFENGYHLYNSNLTEFQRTKTF